MWHTWSSLTANAKADLHGFGLLYSTSTKRNPNSGVASMGRLDMILPADREVELLPRPVIF